MSSRCLVIPGSDRLRSQPKTPCRWDFESETRRKLNSRLRWSRAGELACVFIDVADGALQPAEHAAALEAIHHETCVLPMRLGMTVRDEAELGVMLKVHRDELLDTTRLARRHVRNGVADHAERSGAGTSPLVPAMCETARSRSSLCPVGLPGTAPRHYRQADAAADLDARPWSGSFERSRICAASGGGCLRRFRTWSGWRSSSSGSTLPPSAAMRKKDLRGGPLPLPRARSVATVQFRVTARPAFRAECRQGLPTGAWRRETTAPPRAAGACRRCAWR